MIVAARHCSVKRLETLARGGQDPWSLTDQLAPVLLTLTHTRHHHTGSPQLLSGDGGIIFVIPVSEVGDT